MSERDLEVKGRLLVYDRDSLLKLLTSRKFKIHKACYDRYNKTRYDKALGVKRKKKQKRDLASSIAVSTRAQSSSNVQHKQECCVFCGDPECIDSRHPDRSKIIHAAGAWKVTHPNVEEFSDTLRRMACKLQDSRVLSMLDRDVRSNELYYHLSCYNDYCKR